jgi:hypothetical protein
VKGVEKGEGERERGSPKIIVSLRYLGQDDRRELRSDLPIDVEPRGDMPLLPQPPPVRGVPVPAGDDVS